MKTLELFSGAGGLAQGLSLSGFKHSKFVELNHHACNTLKLNFEGDLIFEGDVRDFDFNDVHAIELVAGGPPCQPFSLAGKHKASTDARDMFPYAINAIKKLQPKAFIFENVKGLLRETFSEYLEYILLRLSLPERTKGNKQDWREHLIELRATNPTELHYDVTYKLLNAANYGIPQVRERVFIVGIRSDLNVQWSFPKETHSKNRLIYEQKQTGEYWDRHGINPDRAYLEQYSDTIKWEQFPLFSDPIQPWKTVRDALSHLPNPQTDHVIGDHTYKDGARSYPGHTGSYIDLPAKTLKAGVHGVPGGENMIRYGDGMVRYFTVHEAKLLQGFSSEFQLSGAWSEAMRQIGNAVPVDLAFIIGEQLKKTLMGSETKEKHRA